MYQCTKCQECKPNQVMAINILVYKFLMPEAICCCLQTCKCGFDIRVVLCTSVPSVIVRNASYNLVYKFLMPEAICCCLQLVNVVLTLEWYCVPVYQVNANTTKL